MKTFFFLLTEKLSFPRNLVQTIVAVGKFCESKHSKRSQCYGINRLNWSICYRIENSKYSRKSDFSIWILSFFLLLFVQWKIAFPSPNLIKSTYIKSTMCAKHHKNYVDYVTYRYQFYSTPKMEKPNRAEKQTCISANGQYSNSQ